ncbi:MAG TPA: hypothetical protein VNH18_07995, partial [Bryobacteraceae bacterium]|nr:hypothetical protein [Bryobacteraceae bacterium]
MASVALRQIFIDSAKRLLAQGDHETSLYLLNAVAKSDAEAGRRIGRKRGSTAAMRQAQAQEVCSHCNDTGAVVDGM